MVMRRKKCENGLSLFSSVSQRALKDKPVRKKYVKIHVFFHARL